jgi:cyanophycinase
MTGIVALLGSGEYLDVMNDVDRRLLAETGKSSPRVACLPTAAGQEGPTSIERWSRMGVEHFTQLGATVEAVPVVDRASADDPKWADAIRAADLIYFSGGDPGYLHRTLAGSLAWQAVEDARARGAVFAGCSAGAMIVGQYLPDRFSLNFNFAPGFGWLSHCLLLPHFDRLPFRALLLPMVRRKLADGQYTLGIDENTALVGRVGGEWDVMGASRVSISTRRETHTFPAGSRLTLPV